MIPNKRVRPRPFIQVSEKAILKSFDAFRKDLRKALKKYCQMRSKIRKILKKRMRTSFYGQRLELVSELMSLSQNLKEKLHSLETQELQKQQSLIYSEMILPQVEESSGNFEIPLSEELYQQLCTHLESDRIEFMGIA